jgi:integrase
LRKGTDVKGQCAHSERRSRIYPIDKRKLASRETSIFEAARSKVIAKLKEEERDGDAKLVADFQFRDLRAKAGTDQADTTDIRTAQQQLGHKSIKTTEIYVRGRKGEKVRPTK